MSELLQEGTTGRKSHVESEMQQLPENVQQLREVLIELEKRLDSVLINEEASDNMSQPRELLVPLADRLQNANDEISRAISAVRSMLARLEL